MGYIVVNSDSMRDSTYIVKLGLAWHLVKPTIAEKNFLMLHTDDLNWNCIATQLTYNELWVSKFDNLNWTEAELSETINWKVQTCLKMNEKW